MALNTIQSNSFAAITIASPALGLDCAEPFSLGLGLR